MSTSRLPLPVLPLDAAEAGCPGCSRRAVLGGLAGVAAALIAGCGSDAPPDELVDAPSTGLVACGVDRVCLDLGDSANAALLEVGGARTVDTSAGRLILVRTTATEVAALSAICTHSGCTVRFDLATTVLTCPCHGSRFALTGEVLRSPALRPLAVFTATLDPSRNVIEVVLAA